MNEKFGGIERLHSVTRLQELVRRPCLASAELSDTTAKATEADLEGSVEHSIGIKAALNMLTVFFAER